MPKRVHSNNIDLGKLQIAYYLETVTCAPGLASAPIVHGVTARFIKLLSSLLAEGIQLFLQVCGLCYSFLLYCIEVHASLSYPSLLFLDVLGQV